MILDSLSNLRLYRSAHRLLPLVSEFIFSHDSRELEVGKVPIGHGITVIIDNYTTVSPENRQLECHRKFIDLQVVLSGVEKIGFSAVGHCTTIVAYNEDRDVELMQGPMDRFTLHEGDFALFFPHDAHMPGLVSGETGVRVNKMVVKVPVV